MSTRTLQLDDRLYDYLCSVSVREHPRLAALRTETAALPMAVMQISPEQGQFMAFLLRLMGARRCIEVGTFTGYSALACALALPEDGNLIALDISREWTDIAQRHWRAAGVAEKIDLRLGPAKESMMSILAAGGRGQFDFVFVDADKPGYRTYCELGLELLRSGGLLAVDNVLWSGAVADPEVDDEDTVAIRAVNEWLFRERRVDLSMLPIGDGLSIARKRF